MFEQITVNALKSLDSSIYDDGESSASSAMITIEDALVRWTVDGTTPSSLVGHLADSIIYLSTYIEIQRFRIINTSDTARISVSYDINSIQTNGNDSTVNVDLVETDVAALLEKKATANNISVTVGATSTTVLAANANRIEADFTNDSDETIYLAQGAGAAMNSGIRLNANGGSKTIRRYTGIVTAICASGSKNLCASEV